MFNPLGETSLFDSFFWPSLYPPLSDIGAVVEEGGGSGVSTWSARILQTFTRRRRELPDRVRVLVKAIDIFVSLQLLLPLSHSSEITTHRQSEIPAPQIRSPTLFLKSTFLELSFPSSSFRRSSLFRLSSLSLHMHPDHRSGFQFFPLPFSQDYTKRSNSPFSASCRQTHGHNPSVV